MVPLSVLDLTPIRQGGSAAETFRETIALAKCAEGWGYHRYWLVEHHNTAGVAGSATAVLIAQVAGATKSIRVGAGGIMLPNHSPLQVAEQFGTLAALYPGRIDLGLGRGINADPATMRALRRMTGDMERFPADVREVLSYFQRDVGPPGLARPVRAIPGEGADVPVWILGSGFGGAQLAAALGLPFAYAAHFAPDNVDIALTTYRARFTSSAGCAKPHVMLSLSAVVADTDDEARLLFSSAQAAHDGPLPPPVADFERRVSLW